MSYITKTKYHLKLESRGGRGRREERKKKPTTRKTKKPHHTKKTPCIKDLQRSQSPTDFNFTTEKAKDRLASS